MSKSKPKIHKTAEVSPGAKVGHGTKIWHHSQVREKVEIGENCTLGKGVYIDKEVVIGSKVKIQNYASIYYKSIIENGVFIGPYVCLTNDKLPRAINPDGTLKKEKDWKYGKIIVRRGASIGAGSIVLPDVEIGEFALIGADSLITGNIPAYALAYGVPAKIKGYVCKCGEILTKKKIMPKELICKKCKKRSLK